MSDRQSTPIREIQPVRDYARLAIEAVKTDQRDAVLEWRIANYIAATVLTMPAVDIERDLPKGSDEFYLAIARVCIALVKTIDGPGTPTPSEIRRVEHRRALSLARSRVRVHALANLHAPSLWKADPEQSGVELLHCVRCGAEASLYLPLAHESLSEALLRECRSRL